MSIATEIWKQPRATGYRDERVGVLESAWQRLQGETGPRQVNNLLRGIVYSPQVQGGNWGSLEMSLAYPKEPNDPDKWLLNGMAYLLLRGDATPSVAENIGRFVVDNLVQRGRYDILGSDGFFRKMRGYAGRYGEVDGAEILYNSVRGWLDDVAATLSLPASVTNLPRGGNLLRKCDVYEQVMSVFDTLYRVEQLGEARDVQEGRSGQELSTFNGLSAASLMKIQESHLMDSQVGLLRLQGYRQRGTMSDVQHRRKFLLSIPGLRINALRAILDFVREVPNTGRGDTGALPSMLPTALARAHLKPSEFAEMEARVEYLQRFGWPAPPAAGHPKPPVDKPYFPDQAYEYLLTCQKNGWPWSPDDPYFKCLPAGRQIELLELRRTSNPRWTGPLPVETDPFGRNEAISRDIEQRWLAFFAQAVALF